MSGFWNEKPVLMIAADLSKGAKAEIIGDKCLRGTSPQYVEIDGIPVEWPMPPRKEAIGVRTTLPDGYVALYLTTNRERARSWLDEAKQMVADQRA